MLKHAHGSYTEEHVKRCNLTGCPVGQSLDHVLEGATVEKLHDDDSTDIDTMYHPAVETFIEDYAEEELWTFEHGLFHQGYEGFSSSWCLANPVGMGRRIAQLVQPMDQWRDFAVNNV